MQVTFTKKTYSMAVLAYLIPTFVHGASWHLFFFKELYESFGIYTRANPIIPLGFVSMLIQGILLAYLYPFFHRPGNSLWRGFKFGMLMGLFLFSVSTIANTAKIQVNHVEQWLLLQFVFHLIQFGVTGPLIALAYRDLNSFGAK
ncbi:MAG: DUF1761 domain-containing protein [Spirochaetia bacterium]|nr:DUF1761 domain-containing protein [Spirochaetia bacterium]